MKTLLALLFTFLMATQAFGDNQTLTIDLGEGNGAVIIVGDSNVIYVPDVKTEECEPVMASRFAGGFVVVMPHTVIQDGLIKAEFSRVVLWIGEDGVATVLEAEQ